MLQYASMSNYKTTMRIIIHTVNARSLKSKIIKDAKEHYLSTWEYRSNGKDEFITHSPEQWEDNVILVFTPSQDNTTLTVEPSYWEGKSSPSDEEKGIILGRFAERLWVQYRAYFSSFESFA